MKTTELLCYKQQHINTPVIPKSTTACARNKTTPSVNTELKEINYSDLNGIGRVMLEINFLWGTAEY